MQNLIWNKRLIKTLLKLSSDENSCIRVFGLLGVKIIGRLLESEIEVVGIQRSHENQNISATIISGDIKEIIDWSFLEGVDQVIYLVSAGSPGNKTLTISDYINDDFNVLMTVYKKALDFNVARFIYFSSAGALYRNSSERI